MSWIDVVARRSAVGLLLGGLVIVGAGSADAGVAAQYAPRTIIHKANKIGGDGGYIKRFSIPPAQEYYLDYTLTFRPGFDWVPDGRPRGGKIPGLGGGTGTAGCRAIQPDGWSARITWNANGAMSLYLYHQDRKGDCGDKYWLKDASGNTLALQTGRVHRITERVRVNTPDVADGEIQIWVDGQLALSYNNFRLRGAVDQSAAQVSLTMYHSYFGGKKQSFAPRADSYIDYGLMYVLDCMPDFTKDPGTCAAATVDPPPASPARPGLAEAVKRLFD